MRKANVREYFPLNYADSRKRFLTAVEKMPAPRESGRWKIESKNDSDLFVDYVWFPPLKQPEKLVVLITGIHGSETYTGSAVLNLFIEEMLPQLKRDNLGVFIVHAMNPYGFKHHRRCTENNVNLNRNFSVSGELFKMKNTDSATMNEIVLDRNPVTTLKSKLLAYLRKENNSLYFGDHSLEVMTKAIAPGQFDRADNLEYGGTKTEPQTQALIEKMQYLMPKFKDVLAFDIHTGLGDSGRLHMLTDGQGKALHPELFKEVFDPEADNDLYVFTPASSEGFYPVFGATNSMFSELASQEQRVCAVTLEFGTLGHSLEQQLEGLNRSLIEHQGHHYGYQSAELEKQAQNLNFARSYPDDDNWRTSVLRAAEGMFHKVLSRAELF